MDQHRFRSILVIDDNAPLRRSLGKMLEDSGWTVTMCEDGSEAIRSAMAKSYDAVLVDFNLPDIRGHVITETMRVIIPWACIIGISFRDREEEFLDAGADAFLLKPFDIDDVTRIVGTRGSRTSDLT